MTEVNLREVPTASAILAEVRQGVEAIVRDALNEAERLRAEANETLQQYDATTGELARLRLEIHGLHHEAAEIPDRLHRARLDALIPDAHGEDADALERRYIQVRERLPVATARIGKLEAELSSLVSGGSRPAKVRNERFVLLHHAREPVLDTLNDAAKAVEALREALPDVVEQAAEDLIRERNTTRDGQNSLWGQAKVPR